MATLARHPARLAFRAARLAVYAVQTMNAHDPDWTADLLAVWYWDAWLAGERTRLAFEFSYAPRRPPDRWIQKRSGEAQKSTPGPQPIVPCYHAMRFTLSDGTVFCPKCLTVLGKFVIE